MLKKVVVYINTRIGGISNNTTPPSPCVTNGITRRRGGCGVDGVVKTVGINKVKIET
jgi:hypothetical protein